MGMTMLQFLKNNGVDDKTASRIATDIGALLRQNPQKTILMAQMIAMMVGSGGVVSSKGISSPEPKTNFYESWPCKWYAPELAASPGAVRQLAQNLAKI